MTLPYQVENEHRVFCGGCHREEGLSRIVDGVYDSDKFHTYVCSHCMSVFAVCRECGKYAPGLTTCAYCQLSLKETTTMPDYSHLLPDGFDPANLIPDPSRRANHWIDPETNRVFAMPAEFSKDVINEIKKAKKTAKPDEDPETDEPDV